METATHVEDCTGLPLTCASDAALNYYNEAVEVFVGTLASYLPLVEKALEVDPNFPMARCFQVLLIKPSLTKLHKQIMFVNAIFIYRLC